MYRKKMTLQRRPHITAVNIPKEMLPWIGADVTHVDMRQYRDGRITLTPIHEDVKK